MAYPFPWCVTRESSVSAPMSDVREKAKNKGCGSQLEPWRLGRKEMLGETRVKV